MRIERLDLLAFGPFTDLSLSLEAPGLHIVFGPNEAGKSTALHALDQLFYGIDWRSPYDFVHAKPDLRLGAAVRGDDGGVVEFVRLKRRGNSLVDADGRPLDESTLLRLLNGVDRATFRSTFALDLEELQRGGQELLEGRGELGEALLSAQSSHDLGALRRALEERRDALFLRQGQKPLINQAIKRYSELTRVVRDAQVLPANYQSTRAAAAAAEKREEELRQRLDGRRAELVRLQRLRQVLPSLAERARKLERLRELEAEGPLAPAGFAERLPDVERRLRAAGEALRTVADDIAAKQEELDGLTVDERLLDAAAETERLSQSRERIEADERRLATLDREAAQLRRQARDALREVRPEASLDEPAAFTVDRAARDRVSTLAEDYADLRTRLDDARDEVARRRHHHEAEQRRLEELPDPEDGAAVAAALDAVPAALLDELDSAADAVHEAAAARERVVAEAGWDSADVAALAAAHAPSREQVTAHRDRQRDNAREQERAARECARLRAELAEERLRMEELTRDETVPTEDALEQARRSRDALWRRVRDGGTDGETLAAYERAVDRADGLADRALAGAQRIVERQRTRQRIAELENLLEHAEAGAAALREVADDLAARWRELWPDPVLPAPDLDAAETVLDRLADLRHHHQEHTAAARRLSDRRDRAAAHAERLGRVLREAGLEVPTVSPADSGEGRIGPLLRELREIAAAELARRDRAARDRESQRRSVAEAERSLTAARAKFDSVNEAMLAWKERWRPVAASLDLSDDRLPREVLGDLDQLSRVASLAAEAELRTAEAEELRCGITVFHDAVRAVLDACGVAVPDTAGERHRELEALRKRAEETDERERRRRTLTGDLDRLQGQRRERHAQRDSAETELARMCEETGVASVAELRAAIARSTAAAKLREDVELLSTTIAKAWDGGVAAAEDEAAEVDQDALPSRLQRLEEEIAALEDERTRALRELQEARAALERIDGSSQAALAAQEREEVLAQLSEAAEEHTRLVLAHAILVRCMEEHRQANQDPILGRAQNLFGTLTGGRFRELRAETSEDGATVLLARRDSGELLGMDLLSEGTRDQLYLALRLASLERYAAEGRSMPFVLDDVFMTFDEERTAAGLRVLDDLADRFQPVVFTHHAHLADLARDVLPEDRVHVHRLRRFTPGARTAADGPSPAAVSARSADPPERRCRECGSSFVHRGRGRPPARCP
ncbi:ATP-binding protein, partial [Thermobifida halotolerans]